MHLDWTPSALSGLAVALLCCGSAEAAEPAQRLYVAVDGNDAWSGTLPGPSGDRTDGPFATLERARDAIRALKQAGRLAPGGVTVELRGGVYQRAEPFVLTAEDSGTAAAPIVYRNHGNEVVRMIGGRVVEGFVPTTDPAILERLDEAARGEVLQADLAALGITDYGELTPRGMGRPMRPSHLELSFGDRPMTLARWPNEGYVRIAATPKGSRGGLFGYDGDRPRRWVGEPDVWVYGYWFHDWADTYEKVARIDLEDRIIYTAPPHGAYGYKKGQRFYALNILAELDAPGEWYLDRDRGILYFWPPSPLDQGTAMVSLTPTLFQLDETSYVTIRGLTIEVTRATAVVVRGGRHNLIAGCVIRNTGNRAVSVSGSDNGVVGCDMYALADGGISLSGGDRPTLTPANLSAVNNHIHDYSRWCRTYRPAVGVAGVGNRVAHNLIHDGPHNAIQLSGNDHVIEYNEIHSVCYDTGDVGAFYMGRDWTARGTVIRYNYFHDIAGPGRIGAMGVYLDDQASGITIYGNLFSDVTRAAFIGGGCDNKIENNVFVDCVPAVHIDARGLGWQKKATDDPKGTLRTRLARMPYQNELYRRRYPELVNILNDDPGTPKRNRVRRNICVGGRWDEIHGGTRGYQVIEDNLIDVDPLFVDREAGDFRLKDDSPALTLGFEPLPYAEMGLYEDELRASWPVHHKVRELPRRTPPPPRPSPRLPKGAPPVYRAPRAIGSVTIDGDPRSDEWAGLDRAEAMVIEQEIDGRKVGPPSYAWVAWTDDSLLVAIDNSVAPDKPLPTTHQWGQDDAVELAIRNPAAGDQAPILVLRGYPSGYWESSAEAGANEREVKRAAEGVEYGARIHGPGRWTAEWRVPFRSLGIDPAKHGRFQFNLSVRKSAGPHWMMWESTRGNTHRIDQAGILELVR